MLQTCEFSHLILCHCWPFPTVEQCTRHVISTNLQWSSSRPSPMEPIVPKCSYSTPPESPWFRRGWNHISGTMQWGEDERWMESLLVKLRLRSLRCFAWSQSTSSYGERRSGALNFKVRPPLEASLPHRNLPMPTQMACRCLCFLKGSVLHPWKHWKKGCRNTHTVTQLCPKSGCHTFCLKPIATRPEAWKIIKLAVNQCSNDSNPSDPWFLFAHGKGRETSEALSDPSLHTVRLIVAWDNWGSCLERWETWQWETSNFIPKRFQKLDIPSIYSRVSYHPMHGKSTKFVFQH